jgi:serine/threonine protein kinase
MAPASQKIGPRTTGETLGVGGNAEVFKATNGQQDVALKVLKTRRAESEQYARFRREIELLRRHGDDAGGRLTS